MSDNLTKLARPPARAGLQVPGLIVTPRWLVQQLDHPGLCLLDVRERDSYDQGHIRGALPVDLAALTRTDNGVEGMLLPPDPFTEQMRRLGVSPTSSVILYDANWGVAATRVLWSLVHYGHDNVAVLTGGSDRWEEEGHPWTAEPSELRRGNFVVRRDGDHLAEGGWLMARLDQPDVVLIDTRTRVEFAQGHLPGAIHWDWMNGVPLTGWDTLRPADELLPELANLGVTPDKEIITYCRSGVRAAHTYLLLRTLGYPRVRVYDGSWLEWSHNNGSTPKSGVSLGG